MKILLIGFVGIFILGCSNKGTKDSNCKNGGFGNDCSLVESVDNSVTIPSNSIVTVK